MNANRKPMTAAKNAAKSTFDSYLIRSKATASMFVPQEVIDAAKSAFVGAGGTGEIKVVGSGNATHPVISVDVKRAK